MKKNALENSVMALQGALKETRDPEQIMALCDRILAAVNKMHNDDLDPLLTQEQAAEYLGIKPQTLRIWVSEQRVPCIKVGSLNRFDRNSLKKWALQQETKVHKAWR